MSNEQNSGNDNVNENPESTAEIPAISPNEKNDNIEATRITPIISGTKGSGQTYIADESVNDNFINDTKKTNKGGVWVPAFGASLIAIITCMALIIAYVAPILTQHGVPGGIAKIITPMVGITEPPRNTNVLLVGTDRGGYRTDTMMIASYDNNSKVVNVMQLPRDTFVGDNGRRDKKINSAYFSGVDQLVREVKIAYGIVIHKYVAIELDAFIQIVDTIGGVPFDVPINMDYDDPTQDLHIHIQKGYQVLDGHNAEGFVRYRKDNDGKSYPLGDIDRMKAQKNFLVAMMKQIISSDGLSKISELISIVSSNVSTNITYDEAYAYISTILTIDQGNIQFHEPPGEMDYRNKGWYFFVDEDKASSLAHQYFNGDANTGGVVKSTSKPTKNSNSVATAKPKTETKNTAEPDYTDVDDEEKETYYTKTPTPKNTPAPTKKPEQTKKPSVDEDEAQEVLKPTAKPTDDIKTPAPITTPQPGESAEKTPAPAESNHEPKAETPKQVSSVVDDNNLNREAQN